jgi:lipopolysaccharide export system protein LptA
MIPRRASLCLLLAFASAARGPGAEAQAPASPAAAAPLVPTVIESGALDMVSTEKETTFTYSQGVKVTATNLALTCDELVVVARRSGDPAAVIGKQEKFKSLIATGNVRIVQDDREATAARAEVFPDDDKVVLSGNPVVRSVKDGWQQTGPKMELLRGERRALIKSEGDIRPRTILPPLKDLGYDKVPEKKQPAVGAAPATEPPAPVTVPLPPPRK